jgi:hypothetical protein
MKKLYKITIILFIIITIFSINYRVNAKDIWAIGKAFIVRGSKDVGTLDEGTALLNKLGINTKGKFEELIDFLWGLGLLAIFITTITLGIRYMFVLPSERSRIIQATTPYVVGVVIIFGALTIWKFIIIILDGSL